MTGRNGGDLMIGTKSPKSGMKSMNSMTLQKPGYLQGITQAPLGTSINGFGSAHRYETRGSTKTSY